MALQQIQNKNKNNPLANVRVYTNQKKQKRKKADIESGDRVIIQLYF